MDPSNKIMKFDRVRARAHLLKDKKLSRQLLQLSKNTEKIVDVFKKCCSLWCSEHIQVKLPLFASLPAMKFVDLPEIMRIHIFQHLLWQIGAGAYPASNKSIKKGLSKITARKKFTLAGCIVNVTKENIEIHAERKRGIKKPSPIVPISPIILDNRWLIKSNGPLLLGQMSDECYQTLRQNKRLYHFFNFWPYPARLCVPIIVDLDGRVIQPHIELVDQNFNVYQNHIYSTSDKNITLTPLREKPFWSE